MQAPGASYVQKNVQALDDDFIDLPYFHASDYSTIVITQVMIVVKSQLLNFDSKGHD